MSTIEEITEAFVAISRMPVSDGVNGQARASVARKLAVRPRRYYRAEWTANGKVQHGPQYDSRREAEAFARGVRAALDGIRVSVLTVTVKDII